MTKLERIKRDYNNLDLFDWWVAKDIPWLIKNLEKAVFMLKRHTDSWEIENDIYPDVIEFINTFETDEDGLGSSNDDQVVS